MVLVLVTYTNPGWNKHYLFLGQGCSALLTHLVSGFHAGPVDEEGFDQKQHRNHEHSRHNQEDLNRFL